MYIERHAEKAIKALSKMFGAVLVTGSRQVGKTTLLRKTVPSVQWISLDDPNIRVIYISYKYTINIIYTQSGTIYIL